MLCEQVLGKLHDFDITGKTIEYVDIEWHEAFKKIHKKTDIFRTYPYNFNQFRECISLIFNYNHLIKRQIRSGLRNFNQREAELLLFFISPVFFYFLSLTFIKLSRYIEP